MLEKIPQTCSQCLIDQFCFPEIPNRRDEFKFSHLFKFNKELTRGQQFIFSKDRFNHLFLLRKGVVKAISLTEQGNERIHGFYFPGELIGLEAIANQQFPYDLIAITACDLCLVDYEQLVNTACQTRNLQYQLLKIVSQQSYLCTHPHPDDPAEKRVATFLLNIAIRINGSSSDSNKLEILISWQDVGKFLGLAPATVSRVLKKWQENNWIDVQSRKVIFLNKKQITIIAEQ